MNSIDSILKKINLAWLYGGAIFVSAFLLFQIQPLISKYILPWFGGGTSVWTTAQVFFQAVLLGGYAYAHGLARLGSEGQGRLHLGVMGVVAAWLVGTGLRWGAPVTPDAAWKPAVGGVPALQVLGVLAVSVGLPYFLLSTSSSLLQAWYSRLRGGGSPYGFYVLSNAASLLALLSYPVVVEPALSLRQQALVWALGFGLYLILLALCARTLIHQNPPAQPQANGDPVTDAILAAANEAELEAALRQISAEETIRAEPPGWGLRLLWVGLAACATTLSLAVTNQITQDTASVPFLWVLPLSLYLLTFMLGFHDWIARQRVILVLLTLGALGVGLLLLTKLYELRLWQIVLANCFVLFIVGLLCHSQLYRTRPHPRHLTVFYLMISLGGALGGAIVSLIAPAFFRGFWEFPLALVFCALVVIQMAYGERRGLLYRLRIPVVLVVLVLEVFIIIAPVATLASDLVVMRNFYGVLRVRTGHYTVEDQTVQTYSMINGAIMHGLQAVEQPWRGWPTSYYTADSGAAVAIRNSAPRLREKPIRAGFIGLGVGTLALYGEPGDTFRFYEINPQVIQVAQDTRYFTFLQDSRAYIELIEGDARLSMERELHQVGSQRYDVLVIDAFSGDSIPVHLLSKEAAALYLAHLKPDGVLAFHISNRYINLEPVLWRLQEELGLHGVFIEGSEKNALESYSKWVLLTRNAVFITQPEVADRGRPLTARPGMRLWTDDFSNLFQVLK